MAYGYNPQGQVVWVDDANPPQGGTAMPTSYYAGKGGVIPMDPSDPRYASSQKLDDNGFMALAMGNPGTGKKYNGAGEIVNTSPWQKFSTGFDNTVGYGMAGMGLGAAGLAGGLALSGAYGGGALAAAPAASGGEAAAGGTAAALPAGWAPVTMGSGGAWGGAGAAGSTASTVGETVAKKAAQKVAQTAAQKAAKKWMTAGAVVAPAVAGLYAATRGKSQPSDINQALTSLLQQQTDQMNQEQPLRRLLLSQQAGMLPTYMKQDPGYQQWLQNSAPAAQSAMNAVARPRLA